MLVKFVHDAFYHPVLFWFVIELLLLVIASSSSRL